MKIATYNILDGCEDDQERLTELGDWLTGQSYDVVGLNELNGWEVAGHIPDLAREWGYPHSVIFTPVHSRYAVGLIAREPVEVIDKIEEGLHHGLLHVVVGGIHYLVTHLTPRAAADRRHEAVRLTEIISTIDEPTILMGDMNTLSPLDKPIHDRENIAGRFGQDSRLTRKYLADGKIDYVPMQTLLDAELTDAAAGSQEPTVPTRMNHDPDHRVAVRIDYVLHRNLGADMSCRVPHGPTDRLSDHYPVECNW